MINVALLEIPAIQWTNTFVLYRFLSIKLTAYYKY